MNYIQSCVVVTPGIPARPNYVQSFGLARPTELRSVVRAGNLDLKEFLQELSSSRSFEMSFTG